LPVCDYLILLKKLDESSIIVNYQSLTDAKELLYLLRDIEIRLMHFNINNNNTVQPQDEFEIEVINIDSANVFRLYGGVEV
jgi:hypothetical protein